MSKLGPYDLNQIYAGDAKDLLAELPEGCIDLTVTSPPYDNLRDYKGYTFDFEPIATELFRVTKQGGVAVWVVGDAVVNGSETGTSFKQALGFMELGLRLYQTIIYWKNAFPFPQHNRYARNFEYMFVFSKGRPRVTNISRVPTNQASRVKHKSTYRTAGGAIVPMKYEIGKSERNRENIWIYNVGYQKSTKDKAAHQHPAIFPEALARDHILSWSNLGDVVLDPMCGSGTTLKMAKQLDRRWLGFDISPEYVELAQKRVSQAQPPLFTLG